MPIDSPSVHRPSDTGFKTDGFDLMEDEESVPLKHSIPMYAMAEGNTPSVTEDGDWERTSSNSWPEDWSSERLGEKPFNLDSVCGYEDDDED